MAVNRGSAVSWSLGLGVLSAAVAGSVVSSGTPARELRHIGGFALLFVPALYALITRQWTIWNRKHPFIRFVVFFLSALTAIVVLGQVTSTLFGGLGALTQTLEFLAAIAGFGVAVWIGLYGGAERIWTFLIARSDIDW